MTDETGYKDNAHTRPKSLRPATKAIKSEDPDRSISAQLMNEGINLETFSSYHTQSGCGTVIKNSRFEVKLEAR